MIRFLLLVATAPLALAAPASAQTMGAMPGMNMPGMHHPPARARPAPRPGPQAARPARRAATANRRAATPASRRRATPAHRPHAAAPPAHDMSSMPGMQSPAAATPGNPHAGHDMGPAAPPAGSMPGHDMGNMADTGETGADPPANPSPAAAAGGPAHAADTAYPADRMIAARMVLRDEHGSIRSYRVLADQLEARIQNGRDGYAWDAEAWYGGAINRLWLKSEGEGTFGSGPDQAEAQALWSHALDPWFNLQAGVRYDFRPDPERGYLVLGVEGLAPYRFQVDGAAFLSNKGDLSARFGGEYDLRITQRLILQPRIDLDFSLQDVPEIRIGSGLSSAEAGLRLRYEFVPEFAPYVGVHYGRAFGDTARSRRAAGEDAGGWSFLLGVRTWF
jgi:copper resistance protein B